MNFRVNPIQFTLKFNVDGALGLPVDVKDVSSVQWKHIDLLGQFYFWDRPTEAELENVLMAIERLDFTLLGVGQIVPRNLSGYF